MEAAPTRSESLRWVSGRSGKPRPASLVGEFKLATRQELMRSQIGTTAVLGSSWGLHCAWKMHVLVGRKSMTPVGEVIATAKH